MIKKLTILIAFFSLGAMVNAQKIPLPQNLEQGYPRLYITQAGKGNLEKTIQNEEWAKKVLSGIHKRIDNYVEQHVTDPEWMPSRLQMHWKTKALNEYVNGIYYSHSDGKAPVPTVRFTGSRNNTTNYARPKLEDIVPYSDDPRGIYLPNKTKNGQFEWAEPAKTGGIIHNINQQIIGLARDAAFIYWLENDERFARLAFDVFDTYMAGMYYRLEPVDLLHGHIQTLVGFTCFQVIHESTLKDIAELYDFLHAYIETNHADKMANYETTIKRWTDQVIKNGVPQNNWNLHQANIILKAAMVLQDDENYPDKKGRQFYINHILNVTTPRQWSLTKFIDYGYDKNNGIWNECPGYAQGVTGALMEFIINYSNSFNDNLLPYTPVMEKAVKVLPQYLFPNGQTVGFGDTYYGPIRTGAMGDMIRLAQKYNNETLEKEFTALYRLFNSNTNRPERRHGPGANISSFFASKPLELNPEYKKGNWADYITQTFYAPNISWHVQRIGQGTDGMMVSLNASLGNHMHSNGINMELYGKGFVQGADPGKGAGYLDAIYLEYYSQFPAHNTVMVDGISQYTEMLSHHAFELNGQYPQSEQKTGYYPNITYSDVYFLEPESQSDQNRTVSIVRAGEKSGYYVDVFRSKKQKGGDNFHDYYYHNLGQTMQVSNAAGNPLDLKPSEEMGFAGGHLYALDYMWDKKSVQIDDDYQAEWKIDMPEGQPDAFMNLWMKGTKGREVFTIKSPPCKSFRNKGDIPYDVSHEPYLTLAARQHGEAWEHPFVSVYEPFTSEEGKSIVSINGFEDENGSRDFAGLNIVHQSGREDFVFSSYGNKTAKYNGMSTSSAYALIGNEKNGDFVLFMGNGTQLSANGILISAKETGNVVLELKNGEYFLHNEVPVMLSFKRKETPFKAGNYRKVKLK